MPRRIFAIDHNNVLVDVLERFEVVKDIRQADVIILWQDVLGIELGMARLAHSLGKKVIVLQHGRNATVDYGFPQKYKLEADKICVWGPKDIERLLGCGIPKKRIVLTGTMVLGHLKPREKHNGVNVVFRPAHWDIQYLEENIRLMDKLKTIKGINIITKITEAHRPEDFINPVASCRDEKGHLNICAEVLAKADIVVGVGEDGTFEMMAYIMDIPVVIADIWRPKSFLGRAPQEAVYTDACEVVKLENFERAVWESLEHPEKLWGQRKKIAYEEGGIGLEGNPLDKITKVINEI